MVDGKSLNEVNLFSDKSTRLCVSIDSEWVDMEKERYSGRAEELVKTFEILSSNSEKTEVSLFDPMEETAILSGIQFRTFQLSSLHLLRFPNLPNLLPPKLGFLERNSSSKRNNLISRSRTTKVTSSTLRATNGRTKMDGEWSQVNG
jgi:hypothetical protein